MSTQIVGECKKQDSANLQHDTQAHELVRIFSGEIAAPVQREYARDEREEDRPDGDHDHDVDEGVHLDK